MKIIVVVILAGWLMFTLIDKSPLFQQIHYDADQNNLYEIALIINDFEKQEHKEVENLNQLVEKKYLKRLKDSNENEYKLDVKKHIIYCENQKIDYYNMKEVK